MFGGSKRCGLVAVVIATGLTAMVAVPVAFAAGRYSDVPANSIYARAVERLGASGVIKGCGDGTAYCPQSDVTRGQLALLLDRMSGKGDIAPSVDAATVMGMTPEQLRGQIGPQGQQGPQGPRGPQGPQGPQGLRGPHGVIAAHEKVRADIVPLPAETDTTVVDLSLPAGAWMITGIVGLNYTWIEGSTNLAGCELKVGSSTLASGLETFHVSLEQEREASMVTLIATITLAAPETVELICRKYWRGGQMWAAEASTSLVAMQLASQTRTVQD